jgi:hypothetical protein
LLHKLCYLLIPKNNKILQTSEAGFDRINTSILGPPVCVHYFPEDATYAVFFRDMVSTDYQNSMENVIVVSEKIGFSFFGGSFEGPLYLSWRHIMKKFFSTEHE